MDEGGRAQLILTKSDVLLNKSDFHQILHATLVHCEATPAGTPTGKVTEITQLPFNLDIPPPNLKPEKLWTDKQHTQDEDAGRPPRKFH